MARLSITVCGSGGGAGKGGLLSTTDRILVAPDSVIFQENRDLNGILLYVGKPFEAIAEGYVALEGDNFCISTRKQYIQNCFKISVQQTCNAFLLYVQDIAHKFKLNSGIFNHHHQSIIN